MADETIPTETYPATLPIIDVLLKTNADYRPDLIEKYEDFYEGGERFEVNKDRYLKRRTIEGSGQGGAAIRKARLAAAWYTPHVAGLIDWLISAVFQSEPSILATGPEAKVAYYNSLNTDADGHGNDLPSIVKSRLWQCMLHHRGYFTLTFPTTGEQYRDKEEQRGDGGLDASLCYLDATDVDDWDEDDEHCLTMIRTHCVELTRTTPWGPKDTEKHTWTFITDAAKYCYTASKPITQKTWKKNDVASLQPIETHTLGELPVVKVYLPKGLWVMKRLITIAEGLFNREASEDFALDSSALAIPVINSAKDIKSIIGNEMAAIKLDVGETFAWAVPPSDHFTALRASCLAKRENLFLTVQSLSHQANSRPDNGRASGMAKKYDANQIATLLSSFAAALRDALQQIVTIIQKARGDDDVTITISGLDKFDVNSIENLLSQVIDFVGLPGSETAKKYVLEKLALNLCADAPADIRAKIKAETESLDVSMPDPAAGDGAGDSPPPGEDDAEAA